MSVSVDVAELQAKSAEFGPVAYLVTVGDGGSPHLVSVTPEWSDDGAALRISAGKTTCANAASGSVTLLWAGRPGGDYCLIVDGAASVEDGAVVVVEPQRAVLHRLASADSALPSCVKVLDRR